MESNGFLRRKKQEKNIWTEHFPLFWKHWMEFPSGMSSIHRWLLRLKQRTIVMVMQRMGYLPEKGPQPVFYAKGPDFREHVVLEHARLVDEAPTFAELLGLEFPNVQGSCLWELLKKGRG